MNRKKGVKRKDRKERKTGVEGGLRRNETRSETLAHEYKNCKNRVSCKLRRKEKNSENSEAEILSVALEDGI